MHKLFYINKKLALRDNLVILFSIEFVIIYIFKLSSFNLLTSLYTSINKNLTWQAEYV